MKLVLAYDGSDASRAMLDDLHWAGLPERGDATVLTVADVWLPPTADAASEQPVIQPALQRLRQERERMIAEQAQLAERGAELVRARLPGWQVRAESVADSPAWAIIRLAEQNSADLVLVGTHGHGPLSRMMLGSVSQAVLTECRRSVRIARPHRGDPAAPRVLIPVDGSPDSLAAVAQVRARRWPAGARFRVFTAADLRLMTGAPFLISDIPEGDAAWAHRVAERAATLTETGRAVEIGESVGEPKQEILNEAERWRADMIFLGARGMSRIERFLLGSVSTAVATRARCTVEVVHPDPPAGGAR